MLSRTQPPLSHERHRQIKQLAVPTKAEALQQLNSRKEL
jgi:hypothetical protein